MDALGFGWSRNQWWFDSAFGFGLASCLVCEWRGRFHRVSPRRVSARHPSNFHLRAQMKVTKAKGLNTICVARLPRGHEPELDRLRSRIRLGQDLPKRKRRDRETPRQVALGEPSRGSLQQPHLLAGRTAQIVLRPSSLVTFFWALRRKLLGCRAETRRGAAHENEPANKLRTRSRKTVLDDASQCWRCSLRIAAGKFSCGSPRRVSGRLAKTQAQRQKNPSSSRAR